MSFYKGFNEIEFKKFKDTFSDIEKVEEELKKTYILLSDLDYFDYDNAMADIKDGLEEVRKELGVEHWAETSLYEMALGLIMKTVARKIGRVTRYNFLSTGVVGGGVNGFEPFSVSVSEQGNYYFGLETLKSLGRVLAKTPQDKYQSLYGNKDVVWFLREVKLIPKK